MNKCRITVTMQLPWVFQYSNVQTHLPVKTQYMTPCMYRDLRDRRHFNNSKKAWISRKMPGILGAHSTAGCQCLQVATDKENLFDRYIWALLVLENGIPKTSLNEWSYKVFRSTQSEKHGSKPRIYWGTGNDIQDYFLCILETEN